MNEEALKERLKSIAKLEGRSFQEVWKKLVLERFLVRLAHSSHSKHFVFKGGLLLSHYLEIGRETKDVDFLATQVSAAIENIEGAFQEICKVIVNDGFQYSYSNIEEVDQPHMNYPGYRLNLDLQFGKMKDRIQIDVGVGDIVEPIKESFELYQYKGKPIFEGSVSLQVYPVETIFAEKLETIVSKGSINSRMKDFHDLLLLSREKDIIGAKKLKTDVTNTFKNRNTERALPVFFTEDEYIQLQRYWSAHLRGLGGIASELKLPEKIDELVNEVNQWLKQNKIF